MQQASNQSGEKIISLRKPNYWYLLVYGIIKDTVRLLRFFLAFVTLMIFLAVIFYTLVPPEVFLKLTSFYLPKTVLAALVIFTASSYTLRILLRWISPRYTISNGSLKLYPREIKIVADPPYERIHLDRIKKIWRVPSPIDSFFGKQSTTYLLGVELQSSQGYDLIPVRGQRNGFFKKILRIAGGSLSYRIILSVPNAQDFIREIKIKPEDIDGNLFEIIVFLISFI